MLMRQNGKEADGWPDLLFWRPVIVTPRAAVMPIFAAVAPAVI
jgi:hypothetical protein